MEHSQKNIDRYLGMYPHLQKWVNRCPVCGARGRTPEMPDSIGTIYGKIAADNLKRMLPVLEVDSDGLCVICARLYNRK